MLNEERKKLIKKLYNEHNVQVTFTEDKIILTRHKEVQELPHNFFKFKFNNREIKKS